jgi:VCBS repeat-containing protein
MADIVGTSGDDLDLSGTPDADTIDGGLGADHMTGGLGDDTYIVDNAGDTVVEAADEGIDSVVSSVSYSLAPDVENLYLVGDADLVGIGNDLGNELHGNNGNNLLFGNEADDYLSGNAGNDVLDSDGGNDRLDGGTGDDSLTGGSGDDTYVFRAGYGIDTVVDEGGADSVMLSGLRPADVSLVREGDDVVVVVNGTADRLVLKNWFADASRVESIVFGVTEGVLGAAAIERIVNNAAPVATDDAATVAEDATSPVTGNVLANDSDANPGDFVEVTSAGTYQGLYGTLELAADGSYTYTLDSSLAAVQALAQGETLTESFTYEVQDDVPLYPRTASAQLNIVIEGADEAPVCHGRTITGTNRDDHLTGTACDDVIDGRKGSDTMVGGKGDDTYYVDAAPGDHGHHHGHHRHHHDRHHRGDRVVERANEGHDTVYSSVSYTLPTNVEDLHLLGDKNLDGAGNSAANWIEGNRGNNDLRGGAGDDLLQGAEGKDRLRGGRGVDILQGGDGSDELTDERGSTVFDGGSGDDEMEGGSSADFFAGGRGNDELELGGGRDVIAFNKGDGVDRIEGESQNGVLSLGGGIRYEDLRFRKDGKDLILETGGSDRLVFEDWYKGKQSVVTLQVVAEAMQGFSQSSSNKLLDDRVEVFDFTKLVDAFDDARSSKKNMDSWKLMGELLDTHLYGSDDAALGGDLAYRYGMAGTLSGMSWEAAHGTVAAASFGAQKQALEPVAQLPEDTVKLGA